MHSFDNELVSISFKEFKNDFSLNFEALFENMKYADVTLVSEDNIQVKAHKAVLGASSPFLSNLFLTHSEPQPVVFMKGIRCKELRAVLEFMYVGRVKV